MLQLKDLEGVVSLLAKRALLPRDAGVLLAFMAHTDSYTGRIHVTADRIAEDLQSNPAEVRAAIGRLKRQHLMRLIVESDTGRRYYLLNPWVVKSGRPREQGLAMKQFQEA